MIKIYLIIILFSSLAFANKELELCIIHINDTHSHLASESYVLEFDGIKTYVDIGGVSRVASKIKSLQNSSKNTLTLNAGDTFQGTLYFTYFNGKADASMLNMIDWDAISLGNHEFDNGDNFLSSYLSMVKDSKNRVISANVIASEGDALFDKWKPYKIKEFPNGEKVGIIGIDIVDKTKNSSNPSKKIIFLDELETAQKYIDKLQSMGINKIVLLSHVGLKNDKRYASKLRGVDIIVGGDSHSLMGDFSSVALESEEMVYPYESVDANGKKVCIVQAWAYNYAVGNLNVSFDKNGNVSSCKGQATIILGDSFKQLDKNYKKVDVNVTRKKIIENIISASDNLEIVKKDKLTSDAFSYYKNQLDEKGQVVIGKSAQYLQHIRVPKQNISGKVLASEIAPVVCKAFYESSKRADACIQNAGAIRMPLKKGDIKFEDAYALLPFKNTLYEIKMSAKDIYNILEDALDKAVYGGADSKISTGSFPYAYALRYDINTKANKGNRILNLEIKDRNTGIYSKIDMSKSYVIVTNSYVARGKDGYKTFKKILDQKDKSVDTYIDYAMSFVEYIKKLTKEKKALSKLPRDDYPIKSWH